MRLSRQASARRTIDDQSLSIKFVAPPVRVRGLGMLVGNPTAIRWIWEAVPAEFVGSRFGRHHLAHDITPPARLAQPRTKISRVRAY